MMQEPLICKTCFWLACIQNAASSDSALYFYKDLESLSFVCCKNLSIVSKRTVNKQNFAHFGVISVLNPLHASGLGVLLFLYFVF